MGSPAARKGREMGRGYLQADYEGCPAAGKGGELLSCSNEGKGEGREGATCKQTTWTRGFPTVVQGMDAIAILCQRSFHNAK